MRRLILFVGLVLVVLAATSTVNWRIDPSNDFYDSSLAAEAESGGCLVSNDLVEPGAWPTFDIDLARARHPSTLVLGSSRVEQMQARAGETSFFNAGIPGTGPESLVPLMKRLRPVVAKRATIYIGVDFHWLNPSWPPALEFGIPLGTRLDYLLSRQTLQKSLRQLRGAPDQIFHRWTRDSFHGGCVLERRPGDVARGDLEAWRPDGSIAYRFQLVPQGARRPEDFPIPDLSKEFFEQGYDELSPKRLQALAAALAYAKSAHWKVVGFAPPYAPRYRDALLSYPNLRARWQEWHAAVAGLFTAAGMPFLDLREVASIPCSKEDFVDEGWHPDSRCDAKVRALLDAAAAREP